MTPGSVILARVQQSDGQLKRRPAVVLALVPPYSDFLICGISSKIRHVVHGFDDLIHRTDADYASSGLRVDSLIRLGLLTTIPSSAVLGELGEIAPERLARLRRRLAEHLCPPTPASAEEPAPAVDDQLDATRGEQ